MNSRMIANLQRVFVLSLIVNAGCVSTGYQQAHSTAQRDNTAYIEQEFNRFTARIQSLEDQVSELQQELVNLKGGRNQTQSQAAQEIADLKTRLKDLENQRLKDKTEIVDTITAKVSQLINGSRSNGGGSSGSKTQYGREHKVESGHTLSEIAKAYGVSIKAIIKANNLKNPNDIKVGQTLFIPD